MKCIKCGAEGVAYDAVGNMFYCNKCNSLFSEDEVNKATKQQKKVTNKEKKIEEKNLGTVSHIVFNLLQSLPLFNIIIPILISNSDVNDEDKKFYASRLISSLIILIILVIVFYFDILDVRSERINDLKSLKDKALQYALTCNDRDLSIDDFEVPVTKLRVIEQEEEDDFSYYDIIQVFDNGSISGEYISNVLHDLDEVGGISILYQTKNIAQRYKKTTYRNYGPMLKNAEYKSNSPVYIKTELTDLLEQGIYTDDYGNPIVLPLSDIDAEKSIFAINKKSTYSINCIYDEDILKIVVVKENY